MKPSGAPALKAILKDVGLPQQDYLSIRMGDKSDPFTWTVLPTKGKRFSLSKPKLAKAFFKTVLPRSKDVFVSVEQTKTGEHIFVSLIDAQAALLVNRKKLKMYDEQRVKKMRDRLGLTLLYARPENEKQKPEVKVDIPDEKKNDELSLDDIDLFSSRDDLSSKMKMMASLIQSLTRPVQYNNRYIAHWSNYSICPEVSIGPGQKVILSDETTLCSVLPDEIIFEKLVLIVNCHEDRCDPRKYKVGSCTSDNPPGVICNAVHTWSWLGPGAKEMNRCNHEIQEAIWKNLQKGTVAVHCLAGIHRAACIVACHYLYRYYHLGHKDIPHKPTDIYRCLKAVRPAVSPAYKHVLENYMKFLKKGK